jgi:WD40 repeat protein
MCSEPTRFLTDLLAQVDGRASAGRRLLPGAELAVHPWLEDQGPADKQRWSWALQNRNARAGYLWWLLKDAQVVEQVADDVVRIQLPEGPEDWALIYRDHRWQVDYARLPAESALRLPADRVVHWTTSGHIRQETLKYWRPTWRIKGETVLVDEAILFLAPRPLHGDLVVYHQDMGSRWAMIATLDPETGEVLSSRAAPRIPMSFFLPTSGWWDWLDFELSPDGRFLAVGVQTRLWILEVDTGRVALSASRLPRVTAISWSPDGKYVAAGDIYGGVSLYRGPDFDKVAQARASGRSIHGFAWLADGLLAVDQAGAVHRYGMPSMTAEGVLDKACCGAVRGVDRLPFTGEVVIGCAGGCAPAWLWRWDPVGAAPPRVLADARLAASNGAISADPTGRWLVVGHQGPGGAMALWDLREERIAATFSGLPLRGVSWSPEGGRIYGIDLDGNSWRWDVTELLLAP